MKKVKKKNVGIFIFDLVEVLDFSGPYEVFSSARLIKKSSPSIQDKPQAFNVFTFSEKKNYISKLMLPEEAEKEMRKVDLISKKLAIIKQKEKFYLKKFVIYYDLLFVIQNHQY